MSQDLNNAIVVGCIVRAEPVVKDGKVTQLRAVLGAFEEVTGDDGKPRRIPVYQNVVAYGKEASEFKGKVGDPFIAQGNLRQTSWKDEKDRYRDNTSVRAQTLRALHGIDPARILQDAQGNPMLQDGFAIVHLSARYSGSRGAEYKILNGGATLYTIPVASGEEWRQGDETKEHTNWLTLKLWREDADRMSQLEPPKGTTFVGTYRIVSEKSYEDKNGLKRYPVALTPVEFPLIVGRRGEEPSATSIPAKGAYAGGGAVSSLDDLGSFDFPADEVLDDEVALF